LQRGGFRSHGIIRHPSTSRPPVQPTGLHGKKASCLFRVLTNHVKETLLKIIYIYIYFYGRGTQGRLTARGREEALFPATGSTCQQIDKKRPQSGTTGLILFQANKRHAGNIQIAG